MTEEEKRFMEHRPVYCKECGGKLYKVEEGLYECVDCKATELDDFGKIKEYIVENEGATMAEISAATGVEMRIVNMFLDDGKIQIPRGSKLFISCKRCGCSLRSGRYCPECIKELGNGLKEAFYEDEGIKAEPESPKRKVKTNKMRYLK